MRSPSEELAERFLGNGTGTVANLFGPMAVPLVATTGAFSVVQATHPTRITLLGPADSATVT